MLEQQKINSFVKAFWNLNGWRWCRLTVYLTWFTTYINLIPLPPFQVPMEFSLMAAWAAAVRLSFCDNILSVILQRPHVGCDSDLPNTTWYVGLGETWGAKARRRQWTNLLNWSLENGWWLTRKKVNLSAACMPGLASYAPLGCQSHVERDPIKHDSGVTRMHARRQAGTADSSNTGFIRAQKRSFVTIFVQYSSLSLLKTVMRKQRLWLVGQSLPVTFFP